MTLRRLLVLVKALPPTALIWSVVAERNEQAKKATPEQIRAAAARYQRKPKEASA